MNKKGKGAFAELPFRSWPAGGHAPDSQRKRVISLNDVIPCTSRQSCAQCGDWRILFCHLMRISVSLLQVTQPSKTKASCETQTTSENLRDHPEVSVNSSSLGHGAPGSFGVSFPESKDDHAKDYEDEDQSKENDEDYEDVHFAVNEVVKVKNEEREEDEVNVAGKHCIDELETKVTALETQVRSTQQFVQELVIEQIGIVAKNNTEMIKKVQEELQLHTLELVVNMAEKLRPTPVSHLLNGGPLLSGQAPALAGDEFGVLSINPRDTTTPIPQLPVRPTGDHLLKGGRLPPSQAPVLAGDELGVPSINPRVPTPARDDDLNATRNKAKDLNDDSLNAIPMTTMPRIDALKFGSHPVGNTFFEQRDVAKVAQASVALYAASGNVGELSMHETRMNQIRLSCMTYDNMMCFSPALPPFRACSVGTCSPQYTQISKFKGDNCNQPDELDNQVHEHASESESNDPFNFGDYERMESDFSESDSEQVRNSHFGSRREAYQVNPSVWPSKQGGCSALAGLRMSMPCLRHTSDSCSSHNH
jgi:hypothetical protein